MKVGDYVRTNDGYIAKYLGCKTNSANQLFHYFDGTIRNIASYVYEEDRFLWDDELKNIIKSSPNIIDLIEENDLLKIEYYSLRYKERLTRLFEVEYKSEKYLTLKNAHCDFNLTDNNFSIYDKKLKPIIKSIVTREQFESMEYRIGE